MKKSMFSRGFTLIELLVVIAIIGILAAVVLASLNDARDSGNDASIKQSLGNLRSQAELYYNDTNFTYEGMCADSKPTQLMNAAMNSGPAVDVQADAGAADADSAACHDSATAWAAAAPLNTATTSYWCVDSTGKAGAGATALGANEFVCP